MKAIVYTKENCPWCVKAKQLLNDNNIPYVEKKLGIDFTREVLLEAIPIQVDRLTVPRIWIGENYIGTYDDLVSYLEETSGGYGDQSL